MRSHTSTKCCNVSSRGHSVGGKVTMSLSGLNAVNAIQMIGSSMARAMTMPAMAVSHFHTTCVFM